jgi:deazaflavin-dependent oxidoreductase (nitroreductase family)
MTRVYRLTRAQRIANAVLSSLTRFGLGARYRYILTVRGRRTRLARSTPVDVMTIVGRRFLVAPYGAVNWVRNLRAAKELTLSRGSKIETFSAEEVNGVDAAPVIRSYVHQVPVTRAYWEVDAHSTDADLAAAPARHPVFRLTAKHKERDHPLPSAVHLN